MLELRIKLPFLKADHPRIEEIKNQILYSLAERYTLPSFAMSGDRNNFSIVENDPSTGLCLASTHKGSEGQLNKGAIDEDASHQ